MTKPTTKWNVEVTDTFGGEPNYSWVERFTVEVPLGCGDTATRRAIKKASSLAGCKGRWNADGFYYDTHTFHPHGACIVLMANPEY